MKRKLKGDGISIRLAKLHRKSAELRVSVMSKGEALWTTTSLLAEGDSVSIGLKVEMEAIEEEK